MLKAGTALCHHCGQTSKTLIYENNTINISLKLTRTVTDKLLLELNRSGNAAKDKENGYDDIKSVTFADTNGNLYKGEIPRFIMVNIEKNSGEITKRVEFTRRCPHCNEPLYAGVGTLDLYVIATVGKSSAGKSCWIKAVHYPNNIDAISAANFKYSLNVVEYTKNHEATKATPINEIGETTMLFIHDTEKNEDVAQVMIIDIAGELFLPANTAQFNGSVIAGLIHNNIIDAFLYVDSITDNENDSIDIYNAVNNSAPGILNHKPIAYVLNKYDLVEKISAVYNDSNVLGWNYTASGIKTMPVFNEKSFYPTTNAKAYELDALSKRIATQNHLTLSYRNFARIINRNNNSMSGFIVKTCTPLKNDEKQTGTDYGKADYNGAINVMDPLLYILYKIGIFPFIYKE